MRENAIRSLFDTSGFGLEVGPSYNPILSKVKYKVETIDHTDADGLRKKYPERAAKIEPVDYVSDGGSILETIKQKHRYDFIVASHVIEHIPDIVGFLRDCQELLKPDGCLVLAVPDKRYCFDALRPVSTVGQAVQAFHERRSRHLPSVVFDHALYIANKNGRGTWPSQGLDDIAFINGPAQAKGTFENYVKSDAYRDAHCWQFTPSSFRFMVKTLASLGYMNLGERTFKTTASPYLYEFYAVLSASSPPIAIPDLDLLKEVANELRVSAAPVHLDEDLEEIDRLQGEVRRLEATVAELHQSHSWKVTRPLRAISSLLNRTPR